MSDTLFDITPYKSNSAQSYSPDWRDATGADSAWDESDSEHDLETSIHPLAGDTESNSTKAPTMAEEKTTVLSHAKVEVVEELSPEEEADRSRLELKVERAFYESGLALVELRSRRLYRSTHKSFEEYCFERFGFQRAHSYRLIDAARVVDNLSSGCLQFGDIIPSSESQCRPLIKLEPDEQRQVWQEAVEQAGGKVPPARIV